MGIPMKQTNDLMFNGMICQKLLLWVWKISAARRSDIEFRRITKMFIL